MDSLIDIISLPVRLLLGVPRTCRSSWGRSSMSKNKTRDEMGATDYVVWVEETKCTILKGWGGFESIESLGFPPGPEGLIELEPVNPEEVHPGFL